MSSVANMAKGEKRRLAAAVEKKYFGVKGFLVECREQRVRDVCMEVDLGNFVHDFWPFLHSKCQRWTN